MTKYYCSSCGKHLAVKINNTEEEAKNLTLSQADTCCDYCGNKFEFNEFNIPTKGVTIKYV